MVNLPKRNKSKDNPYTLGYNEEKNVYIVEFIDNKKLFHSVEISKEVYNAFNQFELEDISQIHKYRKHIEHSDLYESTLYKRALHRPISIEDEVELQILNEQLKDAISCLPDTQKRRLKKYYFDNKTYEQIGIEENCTKRAVKFSVDLALKKLSQILKK